MQLAPRPSRGCGCMSSIETMFPLLGRGLKALDAHICPTIKSRVILIYVSLHPPVFMCCLLVLTDIINPRRSACLPSTQQTCSSPCNCPGTATTTAALIQLWRQAATLPAVAPRLPGPQHHSMRAHQHQQPSVLACSCRTALMLTVLARTAVVRTGACSSRCHAAQACRTTATRVSPQHAVCCRPVAATAASAAGWSSRCPSAAAQARA